MYIERGDMQGEMLTSELRMKRVELLEFGSQFRESDGLNLGLTGTTGDLTE